MELDSAMNISLFQTKKDECKVYWDSMTLNIGEKVYKAHEVTKKEGRNENVPKQCALPVANIISNINM